MDNIQQNIPHPLHNSTDRESPEPAVLLLTCVELDKRNKWYAMTVTRPTQTINSPKGPVQRLCTFWLI